MITIISLIFFLFFLVKILNYIYVFQIKEYRFDRFAASIRDNGIVQTFITGKKLPAKSLRNGLIFIFSLLLTFILYSFLKNNETLLFIILWVIPFLAFLYVCLGVKLTGILSYFRRNSIIQNATDKMRTSRVIVIGITGSYGKTTAKEYLYEILSTKFKVAKTDENMNTDVGVALSILKNLQPNTQYFIVEMGAYRVGEIQKICNMVKPTYGILTSIGNQHMDLFGSHANLLTAKKELLKSLPKNGKAFVNMDNVSKNQIREGIDAPIVFYTNTDTLALNLPPCILLAHELGISEDEITQCINKIKQAKNRLTPLRGIKQSIIINNSYSTNVEGFIYSINILMGNERKKKIIVSRGIIELGKEKAVSYDRILHVLAKSDAALYTTDAGFKKGSILNVHYFRNEQQLSSSIMNILDQETVVLFEGRYDKNFINQITSNQ